MIVGHKHFISSVSRLSCYCRRNEKPSLRQPHHILYVLENSRKGKTLGYDRYPSTNYSAVNGGGVYGSTLVFTEVWFSLCIHWVFIAICFVTWCTTLNTGYQGIYWFQEELWKIRLFLEVLMQLSQLFRFLIRNYKWTVLFIYDSWYYKKKKNQMKWILRDIIHKIKAWKYQCEI